MMEEYRSFLLFLDFFNFKTGWRDGHAQTVIGWISHFGNCPDQVQSFC